MSYSGWSASNYISGTFGSTYDYPITLVAWLKRSPAEWAQTTNDYPLLFGANADTEDSCSILCPEADRVTARSFDTSNGISNAHYTFTDGTYDDTWVMVAAVFTSDTLRDIYIENSSNTTQDTESRPLTVLLDTVLIGTVNTLAFEGSIAHVAIFDKALTTAEIDALQVRPETGIPVNLVASNNCIGYWPLTTDQASHPDESGNGGPTLTLQGTPTFNAANPELLIIDSVSTNDIIATNETGWAILGNGFGDQP